MGNNIISTVQSSLAKTESAEDQQRDMAQISAINTTRAISFDIRYHLSFCLDSMIKIQCLSHTFILKKVDKHRGGPARSEDRSSSVISRKQPYIDMCRDRCYFVGNSSFGEMSELV